MDAQRELGLEDAARRLEKTRGLWKAVEAAKETLRGAKEVYLARKRDLATAEMKLSLHLEQDFRPLGPLFDQGRNGHAEDEAQEARPAAPAGSGGDGPADARGQAERGVHRRDAGGEREAGAVLAGQGQGQGVKRPPLTEAVSGMKPGSLFEQAEEGVTTTVEVEGCQEPSPATADTWKQPWGPTPGDKDRGAAWYREVRDVAEATEAAGWRHVVRSGKNSIEYRIAPCGKWGYAICWALKSHMASSSIPWQAYRTRGACLEALVERALFYFHLTPAWRAKVERIRQADGEPRPEKVPDDERHVPPPAGTKKPKPTLEEIGLDELELPADALAALRHQEFTSLADLLDHWKMNDDAVGLATWLASIVSEPFGKRTGVPSLAPYAAAIADAVSVRLTRHGVRSCSVCGCTEDDCQQCVEKAGVPCAWAGPRLCSACVEEVARGYVRAVPDTTPAAIAGALADGDSAEGLALNKDQVEQAVKKTRAALAAKPEPPRLPSILDKLAERDRQKEQAAKDKPYAWDVEIKMRVGTSITKTFVAPTEQAAKRKAMMTANAIEVLGLTSMTKEVYHRGHGHGRRGR